MTDKMFGIALGAAILLSLLNMKKFLFVTGSIISAVLIVVLVA